MATLVSESLDAPVCYVSLLLEPSLDDLEGGQYVGPILQMSLGEIFNKIGGRGSGGGSGGGGSGVDCGSGGGGGGAK